MKLRHKAPAELKSAKVSPEYQAEVDASMARGRRAWEQAQSRLEAAERRLARVKKGKGRARQRHHQIEMLEHLVELRRQELKRIEAAMVAVPASVQHRGRKGHRHVPSPGTF